MEYDTPRLGDGWDSAEDILEGLETDEDGVIVPEHYDDLNATDIVNYVFSYVPDMEDVDRVLEEMGRYDDL